MIARLAGSLVEKHLQRLVIDVGGVGYEVLVPLSTSYAVGEVGSHVTLRVRMHHRRDDTPQLFGFATALEQDLFERLISVSGIGPKAALAVLSGIEAGELVEAIRSADVARLTGVPGIGRKSAERVVVELKDRMPQAAPGAPDATVAAPGSLRSDILSALVNLGYQRQNIEKTVDVVLRRGVQEFEPALREILRELSRA